MISKEIVFPSYSRQSGNVYSRELLDQKELSMVKRFFSYFPSLEALRRGEWDFSQGILS
jgi:hypothetical protein